MKLTNDEAQRRLTSANNIARRFMTTASAPSDNSPIPPSPQSADSLDSQTAPKITDIENRRMVRSGRRGLPIPEEIRDTAVDMVLHGSSQVRAAQTLGISQESVSAAIRHPKPEKAQQIIDKATAIAADIKDAALAKLMASLNLISLDKLEDSGDGVNHATKLSKIAVNLSGVLGRLEPRAASESAVNIVIYAPEQKSEEKYKVIDI